MKKRIISLCISIAMLFSMLPRIALLANATTSGSCGSDVSWTIHNGELYISGSGAMTDFGISSDNHAPWYQSKNTIRSLVIETGVTTIGKFAFEDCANLTSVTIPNTVTSIGYGAFDDCTNLQNITIPNSVTYIGPSCFFGCKNLNSMVIPSGVTLIGAHAFGSCLTLSKVHLPEGLLTIGNEAFSCCFELTEINIPDSVTHIGESAFSFCHALTSITIPESVIEIGEYAFSKCEKLNITIDSNNPRYCCDEYSVLYTKDMSTLITASASLSGDYVIPDGVTTVMSLSFADLENLSSITFPDSITTIGELMVSGCVNLNGFWVDEANSHYSNDEFGVLFNKDMSLLISAPASLKGRYTIPSSVLGIYPSAFVGCSQLTKVVIPNSVVELGSTAFANCYSLSDIVFSENLLYIPQHAFANCINLDSIVISENIQEIGYGAFMGCTNLSSVVFLGNITEIDDYFWNCNNLSELCFYGDAPEFEDNCFSGLSLTVYYSKNNQTWTHNVMQNYGGNVKWVAIDLPNYNGFWLNKDGWSFANSSFSFREESENPFSTYYIPEERYDEVFGSAYLDANKFTKKWGGNCAGMSTTAILFFLDYLDWQTIADSYSDGFSAPNDFYQTINYHYASQSGYAAIGNATEVTRLIEAYQLYINEIDRSEYRALLDGAYHAEEFAKDGIFGYYTQEHLPNGTYISSMLEEFSRAYEENTPLYISLKGDDFSHAIVSRTDKKPEDMSDGWWRVYVYDPNKPYLNDSIAERFWEEYPNAGLKDACNDLEEDVYIELNPSQNLWRYCTSVNSDRSGKYLGCNLNNEVLYIKCGGTDDDGNKLTVKIPEYFYTIDLNDIQISDYVHPTTTVWMPESRDDGYIISVDGVSNCVVYSSSGDLIAVVENGEAVVLNGSGYYAGYMGEAEESSPTGGKLYLPNDAYTVQYISGEIAFLGCNNVINISGDIAMNLTVDVAENSVQILATDDGTVSIKCAHVISADECSYVETEGSLVVGESCSVAYSDNGKVKASTDSKDGEFQLYQKDIDQEEPVSTKLIKATSLWWLWITGGIFVALSAVIIWVKRKND